MCRRRTWKPQNQVKTSSLPCRLVVYMHNLVSPLGSKYLILKPYIYIERERDTLEWKVLPREGFGFGNWVDCWMVGGGNEGRASGVGGPQWGIFVGGNLLDPWDSHGPIDIPTMLGPHRGVLPCRGIPLTSDCAPISGLPRHQRNTLMSVNSLGHRKYVELQRKNCTD